MNTPNTPSDEDSRLDALFAKQALRAKPDFVDRTLDRIRKSSDTEAIDASLDTLLASQAISPSSDFSDRTLARIRTETQTPKKIIPFPKVLPWVATLAAVVSLAFIGISFKDRLAQPVSPSMLQSQFSDAPVQSMPVNTDTTTIERPLWFARELDGAEVFLDNNDWDVIPLLIDY